MDEQATVIFVHVPKSAGLTLYSILDRQYRSSEIYTFDRGRHYLAASIERFKQLPESERKELRLLRGHAPFGMHRFIPRPFTYITILRDPVDRVASHYYYVLQTPHHLLHKEVVEAGMDLEAYVTSGITTEVDDGQCRMIAGVGDAIDFGHFTDILYNKAIEHLESYFSVIGLTEHFDKTLLLLMEALNWSRFPVYTRQNVSRHRPQKSEIPMATRRRIEMQNTYDCALYEYAKKRFEEDVLALDKEVLEKFQRLQSAYAPVGKMRSIIHSIWRSFR